MGERVGMGCPSPRDADDGTRALGALLWVGGRGGGLRGGGGDGGGDGGGLSYPKSIGLSGPETSACQQGLTSDHSRRAQGATPKPALGAARLGRLHQNILAPQSPW